MRIARFVRIVLALDVALVAVTIVGTWLLASGPAALGVTAGGILGTANLAALGFIGGRLVAPEGARWPWALALAGKFALLLGAVAAAVLYVPMDVIGFAVGLSVSGAAVVAGTAWLAARNLELTP